MGCGSERSDWDDKAVQDSLAGKNTELDPKMLAEMMPEVEEALTERCLECLEENTDNVRDNINEQIVQKGEEITDFDKLDQEVWPTHQQLDEMVEAGKELGVPETEIISTPLICGTEGVENMDERIKDVMWALHTQEKIPPWHRDDVVLSKIMYVNRQEMGPTGVNKLADFNPTTKVLHIFKTPEGVFSTKETIKWSILPHEIPHASEELKQRILEHPNELKTVIEIEETLATASGKKASSPYLERLEEVYGKGKISGEMLIDEWISESFRRYVVGECAKVTQEFFDKCFSEEEKEEEEKEDKDKY